MSRLSNLGGSQRDRRIFGVLCVIAAIIIGYIVYQMSTNNDPPEDKPQVRADSDRGERPLPTNSAGNPIRDDPNPPTAPDNDPRASQRAMSFAKEWIRWDRDYDRWTNGFKPFCTEELYNNLASSNADPEPAARITGDPSVVEQNASAAKITIPLDIGLLTVDLQFGDSGWRAYYVTLGGS